MATNVKTEPNRPSLKGFGLSGSRSDAEARGAYSSKPDFWLMAIVAMLLVLGLVMVYSASFVVAEFSTGNPSYYLWRHLIWLGIGLVGGGGATLIDYHWLRRFSLVAMGVVLVLLLAVLVLPESLAPAKFGARRWLTPLGENNELQFQPSELAKVILVLYAAHWLSSKGDKVRNFYYGLVPFAMTVGFLVALVMGQPDLGTSLVIGAIGLGMFFVAGANIFHLMVAVGTAGAAFFVLATTASYRLDRFAAFKDPFSDPTGLTYHAAANILSLGSGGLFGSGLGASRGKFLWLPNVFTDSIFAVIGEELGLVGASLVVLLFVALAWRGMRVASHAPDGFGRLIAAGVTLYIVFQALLNIAVISNLVPFTGIPLPLISYGGTSLAVTMTALGLLLNVSRQQVNDPRLLLAEEQRIEERRKRELLREQREADRQRREAHRKLIEAERLERDRHELSQAAERWQERQAQEKASQYWEERARQSQARRQPSTGPNQSQPVNNRSKKGEGPVESELPAIASTSFLNYQQGEGPELAGTESAKPKLRKPRRDWAKTYEARHNRKD